MTAAEEPSSRARQTETKQASVKKTSAGKP